MKFGVQPLLEIEKGLAGSQHIRIGEKKLEISIISSSFVV